MLKYVHKFDKKFACEGKRKEERDKGKKDVEISFALL